MFGVICKTIMKAGLKCCGKICWNSDIQAEWCAVYKIYRHQTTLLQTPATYSKPVNMVEAILWHRAPLVKTVSVSSISSIELWSTRYKDILKKVNLTVPETMPFKINFPNSILTPCTVPNSSVVDLLHRKRTVWSCLHASVSSTRLNAPQENWRDMSKEAAHSMMNDRKFLSVLWKTRLTMPH
jgi:hypothetical protein